MSWLSTAREGITQAQFIEKIIKDELQRLDILK
ncbi:hypothetical protein DMH88_00615 [Escherichia coli]|nr:hypothetical protein [Escherichia coli]